MCFYQICLVQKIFKLWPRYSTAPESLLWPVFILAALAAVIASQALISGPCWAVSEPFSVVFRRFLSFFGAVWVEFELFFIRFCRVFGLRGVFTLMSQAHALGIVPRMLVLHTNPEEKGQVGSK